MTVRSEPVRHEGRVVATDERNYALRFCDGSVTVGPDRLTVQGGPHPNGRDRNPVVTERGAIRVLHLRCGLFGGTLKRELPSGYRTHVIRMAKWNLLLHDLQSNGWPVELSGLRRPR